MTLEHDIRTRLDEVRSRIDRAARRAGRDPADVRLVAVSKTVGPDVVRAAAEAGQLDFGENRVQEALAKMATLADLPLRWHLVGHLQTNKVRKALEFQWVHSIDRVEVLERLEAAAQAEGRAVEALLQVDLAGESTKHGAAPETLGALCARAATCRAVAVRGLMVLPPYFEDPDAVRPYFRRLRELADELVRSGAPPAMLRQLSMGMTHDFEVAIEEGATIVRVGTAIFGTRPT